MEPKKPQIIAIGGNAFVAANEAPLFETYILAQTGTERPRIAFLATATGDSPKYLSNFYATFTRLDCRPSHVPLFERTPDLKKTLLEQDAIFVGGGNTKSMLAVWREWGIDTILREAWEQGIVLCGVSAGAICWFEQGVTDSWAGELKPLPCLGFLKGSCCPHYDGEPDRRPSYHRLIQNNQISEGIAIDDCAAAHFIGTDLHKTVSALPQAKSYQVDLKDGDVHEKLLSVQQL